MPISKKLKTELLDWLNIDHSGIPSRNSLESSSDMSKMATHYLNGADALEAASQTVEDRAVAFQWRGISRLFDAFALLEIYNEPS